MKAENVIAAAAEQLNANYGEVALWFKLLIRQAVQTMKSSETFMTFDEWVEALDSKIKLPDNFIKLDCCELFDIAGLIYCDGVDFCIQDGYAIFSSLCQIEDGKEFRVRYKGLAVDDQKQLILKDSWERMLVAYCCWKYTLRYSEKYSFNVIQSYEMEFKLQKKSAK